MMIPNSRRHLVVVVILVSSCMSEKDNNRVVDRSGASLHERALRGVGADGRGRGAHVAHELGGRLAQVLHLWEADVHHIIYLFKIHVH